MNRGDFEHEVLRGSEVRELRENLAGQVARMAALLKHVGDASHCRGCSQAIFWVRHANGKAVPYDADGTNHFATCPQAANFKRAGR